MIKALYKNVKLIILILLHLTWIIALFVFPSVSLFMNSSSYQEEHEARGKLFLKAYNHLPEPTKGLLFHDPERASKGVNLVAVRTSGLVYLLDNRGCALQVWHPGAIIPHWVNHFGELDHEGNLYVATQAEKLMKFSANGEFQWIRSIAAHHDLHFFVDGTLLTFNQKPSGLWVKDSNIPILSEEILHLSGDGEILRRYDIEDSLVELLTEKDKKKTKKKLLRDNKRVDVFHINSLDVLEKDHKTLGKKGTLLITLLEINTIAAINPETNLITWSWGRKVLDGPHHPRVLPTGEIVLLDNGKDRGDSRLIIVDPRTNRIVWEYRGGDNPKEFYSRTMGGVAALENGNFLITIGRQAKAIELTKEREKAWEFDFAAFDRDLLYLQENELSPENALSLREKYRERFNPFDLLRVERYSPNYFGASNPFGECS